MSVGAVPQARASLARTLSDLVGRPHRRAIVVGASKNPNAKITVLLFPDGADRPDLAVKVPTTDLAAKAVDDERRVLTALEEALPVRIAATVPRVVDTVEIGGRSSLVMTALPGIPLQATYHRWRHTARPRTVTADFRAAAIWLADFQDATRAGLSPGETDGVARLHTRFGDDPRIAAVIRVLEPIASRLRAERIPSTGVHGDFWSGNLLASGDAVTGVVDWEAGRLEGEPVRDLARFALAYALYLDRHARAGRPVAGHRFRADRWGAGIVYAIDGEGWFPELFRGFLREGLTRLGVSSERWRDAAVTGIAEVAAFADDDGFALRHLELFIRMAGGAG